MIPVLAALTGAVLAGVLRIGVDWLDRRREREALLKAITGEVAVLCNLIRLQYSPEHYRQVATRIEAGEKIRLPLDLKEDYFTAYKALVGQTGQLEGRQAAAITRFYTLCKVAIDSVRSDGPYKPTPQTLRFTADVGEDILALGDDIVGFPKDAAVSRA